MFILPFAKESNKNVGNKTKIQFKKKKSVQLDFRSIKFLIPSFGACAQILSRVPKHIIVEHKSIIQGGATEP